MKSCLVHGTRGKSNEVQNWKEDVKLMIKISFLTAFILLQTLPYSSLPCKLYHYNLLIPILNYSRAYIYKKKFPTFIHTNKVIKWKVYVFAATRKIKNPGCVSCSCLCLEMRIYFLLILRFSRTADKKMQTAHPFCISTIWGQIKDSSAVPRVSPLEV